MDEAPNAERLQRELELLRLESRALRAHLAGKGTGERIAGPEDVVVPRDEIESLRRARSDLRWLINRLDRSVAGLMLRRRPGYRRLHQDWIE